MEGGKIIVLKNKFNSKNADDIWSTLILTLPIDEINKMTPREDQINMKEETPATDETNSKNEIVKSKPPTGRKVITPKVKENEDQGVDRKEHTENATIDKHEEVLVEKNVFYFKV